MRQSSQACLRTLLLAIGMMASSLPPVRAQQRDLFYQAQEARNRQDWRQAATLYRTLWTDTAFQSWRREEALFWLAYCQQQLGQVEEALQSYGEYLDRYPEGRFRALVEARLRALASQKGIPPEAPVARRLTQVENQARWSAISAMRFGAEDLPLLLDMLEKETDPNLRVLLVERLGRLQNPQVVPPLEAIALTDTSFRIRAIAIQTLGGIRHPSATGTLLRLAENARDPEILAIILPALSETRSDAVLPVLYRVACCHESPSLRSQAILQMAAFPAAVAYMDSLYRIALQGTTADRIASLGALATLTRTPQGERFWSQTKLRRLLQTVVQDTTAACIHAFAHLVSETDERQWRQISPSIFEVMANSGHGTLDRAFLWLFRTRGLGGVTPQRFIQTLSQPHTDVRRAASILETLQHHSPEETERALRTYVRSHRPAIDLAALAAVVRSEVYLRVLEEELASPDPGWRVSVTRGLGAVAHRDSRAVSLLIRLAEADPSPAVQLEAFEQLGHLPTPEAQNAARRLLEEKYR
jgi:HEAT repeat protein